MPFFPQTGSPAAQGSPMSYEEFKAHVKSDSDNGIDNFMSEWISRVSACDKSEAMMELAKVFGEESAACACYRLVLDRVDEISRQHEGVYDSDDPLFYYRDLADYFARFVEGKKPGEEFKTLQSNADNAAGELEQKAEDASKLKIFVVSHKEVSIPHSRFFVPIRVGEANRSPWPNKTLERRRLPFCHYDDEGDNISEKNPTYCEMTAQYWAWKNTDADYYGFCHYRRYFDFSPDEHQENPWGEVMADRIDDEAVTTYGLDDAGIQAAIDGCDVITTEFKDVSSFPDGLIDMRDHYENAEFLYVNDLDVMADIVKEAHPDYAEDVDAYLSGSVSCFCNMYILKRDIFFDYCEWLFPLLEQFETRVDLSHRSVEGLRAPGHLAERLFNIYYNHHMRVGASWKTKQLQCVHFRHPEPFEPLLRAADDFRVPLTRTFEKETVPIVFAADDRYCPQLSVAICSVIEHISPDRLYDFVVLTRDISPLNADFMTYFFTHDRDNVSVRFFNVSELVENYRLEANAHISTETYYRFLIQTVLPGYDKVVYLDSDLIVGVDIGELYDIDLGSNLLAAVPDADFTGNLNMPDGERMEYATDILGMHDPYAYFQAGVLLFNLSEMRALYTQDEWLRLASVPYLYNDQDILNAQCEGRVTFLDYDWNVMVDTGRLHAVIVHAPESSLKAYLASRDHPKVIHFAGFVKPWDDPWCDFSKEFWRYARISPFYEELADGVSFVRGDAAASADATEERGVVRRVADAALPYGTARRNFAKKLIGRD